MIYGISVLDVRYCQSKIDNQKDYLEKHTFTTANGELKSYKDVSMSANISSRYYSQLVNKVNTLQQIMTSENLTPVFITVTLAGVLHDLIRGDYSRFDDYKHLHLLPETEQNGYLKTKALAREQFTASELYQTIRYLWTKFQQTWIYRKMKKEGYKVGYLFNTEPHISGVPHSHILLYIPEHYKLKLLEQFKKIFNAPQNLAKDKLTKQQKKNGEINGFQWTLDNPVAYVMKYCTKSFMDIKNQVKLDELQAWYIKHKIIRISTSHSLVPQWVYKKIYPLENDWLYLSELRNNSVCEWSQKDDYFEFQDDYKKQILRYDRGLYQQFIDGKLVCEFGEKKDIVETKVKTNYDKSKLTTKTFLKQKTQYLEKVKKGDKTYVYDPFDDEYTELPTVPMYMKDFELINYYHTLVPEEFDEDRLVHFGITQNECIKRGLIDGEIQSLNDFNTKIGA